MKKNPGRKEIKNRARANRKAEGRKAMTIKNFADKRKAQGHPIEVKGETNE